ncbi:MAG: hypothetical protein GKR98_08095 [Boseongicola sp.]|nr:MAG: hypothetical protein GKR98_08095 [Boseongicola sp.]
MLPAIQTPTVTLQPSVTVQTAAKAAQPAMVGAPRSSSGEVSVANVKTETARAIDAAEQSNVAPRMRDQETAERSRRVPREQLTAGPHPAFEESILERQARVAMEPKEMQSSGSDDRDISVHEKEESLSDAPPETKPSELEPEVNRQRQAIIEMAATTFATAKSISEPAEPASVDKRG